MMKAILFALLPIAWATASSLYVNDVLATVSSKRSDWEESGIHTREVDGNGDHGLLDSMDRNHESEDSVYRFLNQLHLNSLLPSHEAQLLKAQTEVMYMQEKQEGLNRRLRSGQFTNDFMYEYASESSDQTNMVLNSTAAAMKPFETMLQRAVANFLVGSYLNSVTSGATLYEIYLAAHKKSVTEDIIDEIKGMSSSYSNLVSLSTFASLDAAVLRKITQDIISLFKL